MTSSTTTTNRHKNVPVTETFYGYIETTRDSLLLFEACKRGLLPRITRRLQDKERILIRSGTIFCFDEQESGIKRWTDGLVWSPSRILGNFLIYRELQDKKLVPSLANTHSGTISMDKQNAKSKSGYIIAPDLLRRQQEKALVGSLKTSFKFKRNGLIKKSMSLIVDGVQQHIISYYSKEDVLACKLRTPSSLVELSSLEVSPGLRLRQNFRIPAIQQNFAADAEDLSLADDDGLNQVTQVRNNKRKYPDYKSPSPSVYASSDSSIANSSINGDSPPYSVEQTNTFTPAISGRIVKRQERVYSLLPVTHHSANGNACYPGHETDIQQSSAIDLSLNLLDISHSNTLSSLPFVPCKSNVMPEASIGFNIAQPPARSTCTNSLAPISSNSDLYPTTGKPAYSRLPNHSNNITIDKNFSNTNYASAPSNNHASSSSSSSSINNNNNNDYVLTNHHMGMIASGGYYAPFKTDEYYEGQNPHQHLFSSSSFHAINHASILPSRNTDIIANAFMEDINVLLGTGWNEFELQM